ncbi:electron transport complex protein RnfC, putative [Pseudodesulfovibrio mercurii]|uniref:Electron transport complex protein RnfC, putative n=1 Tax=Pseudodesulfovibrio mercurii TaxID=641491 RepID=F0JDV1_9BACT|nr:electron transporter RnfC [Pseudodesulfovibrio mercurii]EGB13391.1 electron transport complex protein RnfC, putative [Pseudodesulfovibrio mercurii]
MLKIRYSLDLELTNSIRDMALPEELHFQVRNLVVKTKKGSVLTKGEIIAEHPAPGGGAYHAAVGGKVTGVNYHSLIVNCTGGDDVVPPVDVNSMGKGAELLRVLQGLGVGVSQLSGKAEVLVINGLNPEPGVSVAQQLLRDGREELAAGLALARRLLSPNRTVLAVPKGDEVTIPGAESVQVRAKYPYSLDALVVRAVTGREFPEDTRVMNVMDLYDLGRVSLTGLPITETLMTIAGNNYRVPIGTPVRHILTVLGLETHPGDSIVLGGPFRGEAIYSLDEGVKKTDYGLFITSSDAIPAVQDAACINCGECVLQCPARVQPHLISRCAEYERFEEAERYGLNSCFECGLCAFNCFARRPLLQYIRFAKAQLKAKGQGAQA